MNGRFVPLLYVTMALFGLAAVTAPFLADDHQRATPTASPPPVTVERYDPYGGHQFERLLESPEGVLYAIARGEGLLLSYDGGRSWVSRSTGLPRKVVYPYDAPEPRELTSVAFDPVRPGRIAATTSSELYVSENGGQSWVKVSTTAPTADAEGWPQKYDVYTSVGFDPLDPRLIMLGTSYSGFYATADLGRTWVDPSTKAKFAQRGAGLYEEIAGIARLPATPPALLAPAGAISAAASSPAPTATGPQGTSSRSPGNGEGEAPAPVVVGLGFGGGVYLWYPQTETSVDLGFPGTGRGELIHGLWVTVRNGAPAVTVSTNRSVWCYTPDRHEWSRTGRAMIADQPVPPVEAERRARQQTAANRTGIYLNAYQAASKHIGRHLDLVLSNGMNSIVVDCKEDFGLITYDTRLELPQRLGAVQVRFKLEELLQKAHSRGVYVVARIIVFKDRAMYRYQNYAHAVWDRRTNGPWAELRSYEDEETGETGLYQREHWTDPFDPFVTEYNLAIARELEERGVDEIQFDYIRFPSDGDLSTALYRHRREGMSNIDALESFLRQARQSLALPISTDLYGFNSWYRMGNRIGQSIATFGRYVDAVCPMFYPNHFPLGFKREVPYLLRAGEIYREGTARSQSIVGADCLIRPYVQAFLLTYLEPEAAMGPGQYGSLLLHQVDGALEAAASGYALWNASNDYYMVRSSLAAFQPGR